MDVGYPGCGCTGLIARVQGGHEGGEGGLGQAVGYRESSGVASMPFMVRTLFASASLSRLALEMSVVDQARVQCVLGSCLM